MYTRVSLSLHVFNVCVCVYMEEKEVAILATRSSQQRTVPCLDKIHAYTDIDKCEFEGE